MNEGEVEPGCRACRMIASECPECFGSGLVETLFKFGVQKIQCSHCKGTGKAIA